jgi:cytochrome c-type biogenesis protein CcsB
MINMIVFNTVAFIYLFSSLLYFCYVFFQKELIGKAATLITLLGLMVQTVAYVLRWIESYQLNIGHSPLSFFTLYETLIFSCWSMAIIYLVIEYKYQLRILGTIILPLISLGMLYASLSPTVAGAIEELPLVLKGNFLVYHVVSCIMCLVAFLISLVASMLILIGENAGRIIRPLKKVVGQLPSPVILDDLSYKTIAIGFILFSIGITTGAYRTKVIWGSYWNWDPVQTSCLITWLLYALILHGRYQRWWDMKMSSVLSIVAFSISIVCFLIAGSYVMVSGHYPIL